MIRCLLAVLLLSTSAFAGRNGVPNPEINGVRKPVLNRINKKVVSGPSTVSLAWDYGDTADIVFRIYVKARGGEYPVTPSWEGATKFCTLSGLAKRTMYVFTCRAYNTVEQAESGNSNEVIYIVR